MPHRRDPETPDTRPHAERPVTERANPATARLDELPTLEFVLRVNDEDALVASAVRSQAEAIARAIDAIAARLRDGGRLIYLGAGTSGRLGVLDATECPPTFGTAPDLVVGVMAGGDAALTRAVEGAEDQGELAVAALRERNVGPKDAVVGISASGRTPFVLAGIAWAKEQGALAIGVACNPGAALSAIVDVAIEAVCGPEVLAGSTRMKAGTATKLVLNLLSTGAMVRLGRVRGNRMVDVKPTNMKLGQRAAEMIAELGGVDVVRATHLLGKHGGSVRAALDSIGNERTAIARTRPAANGAPRPASGLVAGIDGGGTKTAIAWADAASPGAAASATIARPCNLATDLDGAVAAIVDAVARIDYLRSPLAALVVGAAGAGDAALRLALRERLIGRAIAEQVAIVHDAAPLLAGSRPDGTGLALIAGTGSLCFGRDVRGRTARAGGLGGLLGDEGSAYALGLAALKAAARAVDGRAARLALVESILRATRCDSPRALALHARSATAAQIAELAPLVSEAADAGDPVAERLLDRAADELALMVKTVTRKLGLTDLDALPLVLAGGVLDHSLPLRRRLVAALRALGVGVEVVPSCEPTFGALALARDLAAGRLDEASWFPS